MDTEKSTLLTLLLVYRDADNDKTFFSLPVDCRAYPEAAELKAGDEIEMGGYGTLPEAGFFGSGSHPEPYDHGTDNNILTIISIKGGNVQD